MKQFKFLNNNIEPYDANLLEEMCAQLFVYQQRNNLPTETYRHFFQMGGIQGIQYEMKITHFIPNRDCVKIFYRVRNQTTFLTTNYEMEMDYRIFNRLLV